MGEIQTASECISIKDLSNLVAELRFMARGLLLSESQHHTFSPTGLAMTALRRVKLKEQDWEDVRWENRDHFFSSLRLAMRHALVDYARKRKAEKRPPIVYLPPDERILTDLSSAAEDQPAQFLLVDEAVERLGKASPELADIIKKFYFLGWTVAEIAQCAELDEKTIDRRLKDARGRLGKLIKDLQQPLEPYGHTG